MRLANELHVDIVAHSGEPAVRQRRSRILAGAVTLVASVTAGASAYRWYGLDTRMIQLEGLAENAEGETPLTMLQWPATGEFDAQIWGLEKRGAVEDFVKRADRQPTVCEICVHVLTATTLTGGGLLPMDCRSQYPERGERELCDYIHGRAMDPMDIVSRWRSTGCSKTALFGRGQDEGRKLNESNDLNRTVPDILNPKTKQYLGGFIPSSITRITPCPARFVCSWFGYHGKDDTIEIYVITLRDVGTFKVGETLTFNVKLKDTLDSVKTKICNARTIQPLLLNSQMYVTFKRIWLKDDQRTLMGYNIKNQSTLVLVPVYTTAPSNVPTSGGRGTVSPSTETPSSGMPNVPSMDNNDDEEDDDDNKDDEDTAKDKPVPDEKIVVNIDNGDKAPKDKSDEEPESDEKDKGGDDSDGGMVGGGPAPTYAPKGSKRVVGEVEKLEGARVQTASLFDASWKDQPIEWSKAPVVPIFDEDWANRPPNKPPPQTPDWPVRFCPRAYDQGFPYPPPLSYYGAHQEDYELSVPKAFWGK